MAVYWLGADGNIYLKGNDGTVQNVGTPYNGESSLYDGGFDSTQISAEATRIADPNPPQTSYTSPSGGGEAAPVLDQAAIDATGQAIGALDTRQNVGYKSVDDSYGALTDEYNRDVTRNEGDYGEQTVTNTTNLQKNKQNALTSAAQGRRGLRGVLASIGALFGSGGNLADRAVTTEANADIGGAVDTAATNQQGLDKAIGNYREEDKNRRADAQTARTNQRRRLEGDVASDRQKLYKQMADIYKEAGNTDAASTWLRRAGDLNEYIAGRSAVAATPFTSRAAAFTPGKLEDYLAGAGDMTVQVAPTMGNDGIMPTTLLAGRPRRRDREDALAVA